MNTISPKTVFLVVHTATGHNRAFWSKSAVESFLKEEPRRSAFSVTEYVQKKGDEVFTNV